MTGREEQRGRIHLFPTLTLTAEDARMLYQGAHIGELRTRYRSGDTRFYDLLTDITKLAFTLPIAASGNETRQDAAKEKPEVMTVNQVASAARLSARTVRLDCHNKELPATKTTAGWLIPADEAVTYIRRRRTNRRNH